MWYMPYMRVRRAVLIYAVFIVAVTLLAIAIHFWPSFHHITTGEQTQLDGLQINVSTLLSGAAALVAGFATVLGLNLAAENDGHLEVAWTKPVSREGYALGVFAVDLTAMVVCIAFTVICAGIVVDVYSGHQAVALLDRHGLLSALAYCGFPLCIYAWITALTSSLKRNRGSVAGMFWPVMLILGVLSAVPVAAVHSIATVLNTFNPLAIFSVSSHAGEPPIATYLSGWAIAALLLAFAIVQWRRLEI